MNPHTTSTFHRDNRSEHRIRAENLAFDIDVWYPAMKNYTFPSFFIPLSKREAEGIRSFHNATWRHARLGLMPSELIALDGLEARLDHALKNEPELAGGAFMRLCGRSPKDGDPLDRAVALNTYNQHLARMQRGAEVLDGNAKLVAVGRTTPAWLKVEALNSDTVSRLV